MPTAPPQMDFNSLAAALGPQLALYIFNLFNPGASGFSKGLGGANLGVQAAKAASAASPAFASSSVGQAVPYLGGALAAAGLGYGLTGIAKSNLPIKKKVGHSVDAAVAAAVPMYGLTKVADYVFGQMQKSKSPQVSRFGQTLAAPALPAQAFMSVLKGDQSPRAAGSALLNSTLSALGFGGYKPTTGTMFRKEAGSIFDRIPQFKGTDTSKYNIDPTTYNALPQSVRDAAAKLGTGLSGLAPHSKSSPNAYAIQLQNMLLNRFGANLPNIGALT
jgi:hypothetical protein